MPNTNLIVPQDIEGNISSCGIKTSIINCAERENLFYCIDKGYATNNCTGITDIYTSWSLSGFTIFILILIGILFTFICGKILSL